MSDTDAMIPVGRDLDAVVAEKVMGWTDIEVADTSVGAVLWGHGPYRFLSRIPEYSEDIEAAMTVVEQTRQEGYWITLETQVIPSQWHVLFWRPDPFSDVRAWSLSLPEAICRAALAAKAGQP